MPTISKAVDESSLLSFTEMLKVWDLSMLLSSCCVFCCVVLA